MDIIEQVKALKDRIAALETQNNELSSQLSQSNSNNELLSKQIEEERLDWQSQLTEEVSQHNFTKLQLEEEQKNVELSVKLLRELQTGLDSSQLRASLEEKDMIISKLRLELESERENRIELNKRIEEERTANLHHLTTRQSLQAMIHSLTEQIRHYTKERDTLKMINADYKNQIDQKLEDYRLQLSATDPDSDTSTGSTDHASDPISSIESLNLAEDKFFNLIEMIEEAEGKSIPFELASFLKSAIRDTKQSASEEFISIKSKLDVQNIILKSTENHLDQERKASSVLLEIIDGLQEQLAIYSKDEDDPNKFSLSFIENGASNPKFFLEI